MSSPSALDCSQRSASPRVVATMLGPSSLLAYRSPSSMPKPISEGLRLSRLIVPVAGKSVTASGPRMAPVNPPTAPEAVSLATRVQSMLLLLWLTCVW